MIGVNSEGNRGTLVEIWPSLECFEEDTPPVVLIETDSRSHRYACCNLAWYQLNFGGTRR